VHLSRKRFEARSSKKRPLVDGLEADAALRGGFGLDEFLDDVKYHLELSVELSLQRRQLDGELA